VELEVEKTLKPMPATSRTQSGPQALNISKPIFAQRTCPISRLRTGATSRATGRQGRGSGRMPSKNMNDTNGHELKKKSVLVFIRGHQRLSFLVL